MGLLSPMRKESRAGSTAPLSPADPALADMFTVVNSASGQNVTADTALRISTVYACVNRISKTVAMLPLNVMKKLPGGGKEIATSHRLYRQINARPNRWQTSYDWRLMTQGHILLRGNGYSRLVSTPGRGLNELIPLHPDRVWPFIITPNGVTYYMYDNSPVPPAGSKLFYQYFPINANTEILTDEEVFHIKGYSVNGIVGMNVVKLMRESIGLSMATEEHGSRLFSNGAQISKIFTHPTKMSDTVYKRMKEQLGKEFSGVSNAHKTMILEEAMKVENISMTMEDAQFLKTRNFQVEDIASFLDVPLILINRSSDKNQTFASAEQIVSLFITHQMTPHFVCWEQQLSRDLLYPSEINDGYYFDFDLRAMMRGDTASRATYLKQRFTMASMSPDDIRVYEGESPTGTEEGKKYYLQSGMMPANMAGTQPTKNTPAAPAQ